MSLLGKKLAKSLTSDEFQKFMTMTRLKPSRTTFYNSCSAELPNSPLQTLTGLNSSVKTNYTESPFNSSYIN